MARPIRGTPGAFAANDYDYEEVVLWSTIDNLVRALSLTVDVHVEGMPPVAANTIQEARVIYRRCTIQMLLQRCTADKILLFIKLLDNLDEEVTILKLLYQGAQIFVPMMSNVMLSEDSTASTCTTPTSPQEEALLLDMSASDSDSASPRAEASQTDKGSASIAEPNYPIYQNVEWPIAVTHNFCESNEYRFKLLLEDLILPLTNAQRTSTSAVAKLKHKLKITKDPHPKPNNLDINHKKNKIAVLRDIVDNLMRVIAVLTNFVLPGLPPLRPSVGEFLFRDRRFSSEGDMLRQPRVTAAQIFMSQHRALCADLLRNKSTESTNFENVISGLLDDVRAMYSLYNYQSPAVEEDRYMYRRESQVKEFFEKLINFVTFKLRAGAASAPPAARAAPAPDRDLLVDIRAPR